MKLLNTALSAAVLSLAVVSTGWAQMDGMNMGGAADPMASTSTPQAATTQPSPEELLEKIKSFPMPQPDRSKLEDDEYLKGFEKEYNVALLQRADLVKQYAAVAPMNAQTMQVLSQGRWKAIAAAGDPVKAAGEVDDFAKVHPDLAEKAKLSALSTFYRAQDEKLAAADKLKLIDTLKGGSANDARGQILMVIARDLEPADQIPFYKEVLADFPESKEAAMAKGGLHQAEAVGKPFPDLKFKDSVSGKDMSTSELKGKVVVLDFWATWCGPCKAEMPKMKKTYANFKDKGVEFIGISLDQAGDEQKLKDYVKDNEIAWPQYFQGNFWQSEFSSSWGIMSIPACFVIDADGNLASVSARGKLDKMLPALIKKRDASKSASAQ